MTSNATYLNDLVLAARVAHRAYPQYAKHFDDYKLCVVNMDVRTKAGLAFYKGEMSICAPELESTIHDNRFRTVYSFRTGVDTSVPAWAVGILPV